MNEHMLSSRALKQAIAQKALEPEFSKVGIAKGWVWDWSRVLARVVSSRLSSRYGLDSKPKVPRYYINQLLPFFVPINLFLF